jgi:hypothetical protein
VLPNPGKRGGGGKAYRDSVKNMSPCEMAEGERVWQGQLPPLRYWNPYITDRLPVSGYANK